MAETRPADPIVAERELELEAGALAVPGMRPATAAAFAETGTPARRPEIVARPAEAPRPVTLEIFGIVGEIGDLLVSLAAAQGEFSEIERTLEAHAKSYTFQYESLADVLAAVRPALSRHGLALIQAPFTRASSVVVRTIIASGASGRAAYFYNELLASVPDTAPQTVGSAITFLRRYGIKSLLGLAAGEADDDGAAASSRPAAITAAGRRSRAPEVTDSRLPEKRESGPRPANPPAGPVTPAPGAPASDKKIPALADPASPVSVTGTIAGVRDADGGALISLDNGFRAGTRSPEIIAAARKLLELGADAGAVELVTRPATAPGRAPMILELRPIADYAESEAGS